MVMENPSRAKRRVSGGLRSGWLAGSPRRLAWLLVLLLGTCWLATLAGLGAFSQVMRGLDPALTSRITDDPIAPVLAIQAEMNASPNRISGPDVVGVANASLRAQAINNPALRLLAFQAAAVADGPRAARFAALSERLSRRDLLTQLFLIEQAVQANDVALALNHYDIALRTSDSAREILFPILATAISSDGIRQAVAGYVARRVDWAADFVRYVVQGGGPPSIQVARLLLEPGAGNQGDLFRENGSFLIESLLGQGQFPLATQTFAHIPGARLASLRDAGFTSATTDPAFGPFSWSSSSSGSIAASFEAGATADGRSLRLVANSGDRGTVLRRVLELPPGQYYLSERRSLLSGDPTSRATWQMRCLAVTDTQAFWVGPSERADYSATHVPGPRVPEGCPVQEIVLTASGGEGGQGLELTVTGFQLTQ